MFSMYLEFLVYLPGLSDHMKTMATSPCTQDGYIICGPKIKTWATYSKTIKNPKEATVELCTPPWCLLRASPVGLAGGTSTGQPACPSASAPFLSRDFTAYQVPVSMSAAV